MQRAGAAILRGSINPTMNRNTMQKRTIILPILLGALLVACGEKKQPAGSPKTAAPPATPAPATDTTEPYHPPLVLKKPTLEDQAFDEYTQVATAIPKRVSDSI